MSPRTSRTRDCSFERRIRAAGRARASAPIDRCRRAARRRAPSGSDDAAGAASQLEHRAAGLQRQSCARTARRAGPACARSPSRRTARTRPSLRGLRAGRRLPFPAFAFPLTLLRSLSDGREQHRVLDFDERRAGLLRLRAIGVEHGEVLAAERAARRRSLPRRWRVPRGARRSVQTSSGGGPSWICETGKQPDVERLDAVPGEDRRQLRADRRVGRVAARVGQRRRRTAPRPATPGGPTASS